VTPATLRVTGNFSRNLDGIEAFLREVGATQAFAELLDDLFAEAFPALERFPDLGADFFRHPPTCRETQTRIQHLRRRLGPNTSLRELIRGDYLLLYAHRERDIFLLAIRHHRQLSFDLSGHWPD